MGGSADGVGATVLISSASTSSTVVGWGGSLVRIAATGKTPAALFAVFLDIKGRSTKASDAARMESRRRRSARSVGIACPFGKGLTNLCQLEI